MIHVTTPTLPDLSELNNYLNNIWSTKMVTNNSIYCQELESKLLKYLGVSNINVVTNGTIALILAIKALNLSGEIITTPYTFAATANAILFCGLIPKFVDIDPNNYNINCDLIENAITENTCAIMPVHTYGIPCNVKKLKHIADKYNLKIIYDAAHAFNVKIDNNSILNYGDISILSFHATKVFNTIEGGAIICNNAEINNKIYRLKNFGFYNNTITDIGINGKLDEIRSSIGLLNLNTIDININRRHDIFMLYKKELDNIQNITTLQIPNNITYNYSYFPIFVKPYIREKIYIELKNNNILCRKYFELALNELTIYNNIDDCPITSMIAKSVLCLPIYPELTNENVKLICNIIKKCL